MKSRTTDPPQHEALLLPKSHARSDGQPTRGRQMDPRLAGADLYVARLGWCRGPATTKSAAFKRTEPTVSTVDDPPAGPSSDEGLPRGLTSSSPGSLHDELFNREPSPGPSDHAAVAQSLDLSTVRASRPCYRCVSYMHSVGIKRVFWTNDAGAWEGGKVRDLVDAMDNSMENVAKGNAVVGGPMGNGIFVTKHEVLMLKRAMG